MKTPEHPFITYLETLKEDRGALATLRRGLGQPPGTVSDMFRYVVPQLPGGAYPGSWTEKTYYLVASLFALHPEGISEGNLGNHFADLRDPDPDKNDALERRFTALLTAHPEDLHIYLRQAISFLRSKEEGNKGKVNWHQLMWDVSQLGNPEKAPSIQKYWANAFWRSRKSETQTPSTNPEPVLSTQKE
jgi:CRISPR system Cascade subunit CasB